MQAKKRVGLALGGGAVRGYAHLGVITVLVEAGIPIDYVAGSSVGALAGAIYCSGVGIEAAHQIVKSMHWLRLARLVWPSRGLVDFYPMERWLMRNIGDLHFDQLKTPLAVVTTDLEDGAQVVFEQGRVAPAIRASTAVPGFVAAPRIDGRLLGDGSLINVVPVSVARQMGADYVIGVDIVIPKVRRGWGVSGQIINLIEILVEHSGDGLLTADCLIQPNLHGATYLRHSQRDELIERGRQAAIAALPQIRRDLFELESA